MIGRVLCWLLGAPLLLFLNHSPADAALNYSSSGKTDLWDNPFVAYGVNPLTKAITGYVIALRTSPGRTDDCRFVFAGELRDSNVLVIKYLSEIDGYEKSGWSSPAKIMRGANGLSITVKKDLMGGDCDWIVPFVAGPRIEERDREVSISLHNLSAGDWIGVFAIRSTRAKFHDAPNKESTKDAYLVRGDLIYVYDERPGWYYVKYETRKKKTNGWIKKSDTVQFDSEK